MTRVSMLVALVTAFVVCGNATAGREYDSQQQAQEHSAAEQRASCDADPSCAALRKRVERGIQDRQQAANLAYESKGPLEKAEPWIIVAAVVYLLYRWTKGGKRPD